MGVDSVGVDHVVSDLSPVFFKDLVHELQSEGPVVVLDHRVDLHRVDSDGGGFIEGDFEQVGVQGDGVLGLEMVSPGSLGKVVC